MKKLLFPIIMLISLLWPAEAGAQLYVTDNCFDDSVMVYNIAVGEKGVEVPGVEAFKLPVGVTVKAERLLVGDSLDCVILVEGKEYAVFKNSLIFSDENPEGTTNIFGDEDTYPGHTAAGRFFATMTPYWIILALMLAAFIMMEIAYRSYRMVKPALIITPILMMLAAILEAWAYQIWGNQIFFWCDPDRYGFWGSFFRAIPFAVFVVFQVFSIFRYKILLWDVCPGAEVSIKPAAIGIAICIPATIVATIVMAIAGIRGSEANTIGALVFLGSLLIGMGVCAYRNIRELGFFGGMAFTVFAVVYLLGTIIAVWCTIVLIFKMFLQILITVTLCGILSGRYHKPTQKEIEEHARRAEKIRRENEAEKKAFLERQRRIVNDMYR